MKNSFKVMALALLVIVACSKDVEQKTAEPANLESPSVTLVDLNNGQESILVLTEFNSHQPAPQMIRKSGHVHKVNGHYTSQGGNTTTLAVIENKSGVHGNIQVSGFFDFSMKSECLLVDGNEAVYGGVITSVTDSAGSPAIAVGNYFYLKVIDNGEGKNAPPDQYSNLAIFAPFSLCGFVDINNAIPSIFTGGAPIPWNISGISNVANQGDQIQVK